MKNKPGIDYIYILMPLFVSIAVVVILYLMAGGRF
jgi:hypothetical protein